MKQAYGRDAWKFPELHRDPVKREEPLEGVYRFDTDLLDTLGEPFRWGSLFSAIQRLATPEEVAQAAAAAK